MGTIALRQTSQPNGQLGQRGRRLRVLYLTHHSPWPPTSGGRVRDAALVPRLARYVDIEVWAVSRTIELDRAGLALNRSGVQVRIFPDESTRRAFPTRDSSLVRQALRHRLDHRPFDLVHIEGHYLHHLVPSELVPHALVVEHNVESHVLRQRTLLGAPDARCDGHVSLVAEELRVWRVAPLVVTLSTEDRARILGHVPLAQVAVIGNGCDHVQTRRSAPAARPQGRPHRIGFLANYAYPPNHDALRWLLGTILPKVRARLHDVELVLAGSNLHDLQLGGRPSGVRSLGWVDDLDSFWDEVDVVVCPLRVGGGVKVKMLEAIRGGCAIVSTTVGAEGLPGAVRAGVEIADGPDEFAAAVARLCLDDDHRVARIRQVVAARREMPTWDEVAAALNTLWLALASSRP